MTQPPLEKIPEKQSTSKEKDTEDNTANQSPDVKLAPAKELKGSQEVNITTVSEPSTQDKPLEPER